MTEPRDLTPEGLEDIAHYLKNIATCPGEVAQFSIEMATSLVSMARRAPRWIPVEEQPAPTGGTPIITFKQEGREESITHWMPLPAPPEAKP